MTEGYIYCLTNEAMPGLVKIGEVHTEGRTPDDRARELYTTGVPLPFECVFAGKVDNPKTVETALHHAFLNTRVKKVLIESTQRQTQLLFWTSLAQ